METESEGDDVDATQDDNVDKRNGTATHGPYALYDDCPEWCVMEVMD
jgi:hypothetical protein